MKGRKRAYDRPVQRNITIELWMDTLMEECKKFGIRPVDIFQSGLIAIFRSENKLPSALIKSFLIHIKPKADELMDTIDYYTKLQQTLMAIPEQKQREELIESTPRTPKWFDDFHAVKFLETGDFILIEKTAYLEQPSLFELQDDNTNLDWRKLPKYYAIEAVMKVHSQNGSLKGDATA